MVTEPETVMVPAPRPEVSVPKLKMSPLVVDWVALPAATPVISVFHRAEVPPEVEFWAQVPPALPKPEVVPLLSQ